MRNTAETTKDVILDQMGEPRPLPMGRKEFEEWSDRIISGALIPGATAASQKFALANMILHLGPTESHKPDAFFIHSLRKVACNLVAHEMATELRETEKARIAAEEAAKAPAPEATVTPIGAAKAP